MAMKIEDLLQQKALTPLAQENIAILEKIQVLDTRGNPEAEVRSFVLNPIVKILGYEKGTFFSLDQCTLWEENFWIIEAKKPTPNDIVNGWFFLNLPVSEIFAMMYLLDSPLTRTVLAAITSVYVMSGAAE